MVLLFQRVIYNRHQCYSSEWNHCSLCFIWYNTKRRRSKHWIHVHTIMSVGRRREREKQRTITTIKLITSDLWTEMFVRTSEEIETFTCHKAHSPERDGILRRASLFTVKQNELLKNTSKPNLIHWWRNHWQMYDSAERSVLAGLAAGMICSFRIVSSTVSLVLIPAQRRCECLRRDVHRSNANERPLSFAVSLRSSRLVRWAPGYDSRENVQCSNQNGTLPT